MTEYMIITGLCLWAMYLELRLRKRDTQTNSMAAVLQAIALGKARVYYKNDAFTVEYNRGE